MSHAQKPLSRRTVAKGAAWSIPAVAVAASAPAVAASGDLGAYHIDGTCGVLGVLGAGFALTAGPVALPAGTVIDIVGSGIANIGVFSVTGCTASVAVLSGTSRRITLTAPLAAGATMAFRTTLNVGVVWALSATVNATGTGAKTTAAVDDTLVLCSAS